MVGVEKMERREGREGSRVCRFPLPHLALIPPCNLELPGDTQIGRKQCKRQSTGGYICEPDAESVGLDSIAFGQWL